MSAPQATFITLPYELRQYIYLFVFDERVERQFPERKTSPSYQEPRLFIYTANPKAYLQPGNSPYNRGAFKLFSTAPIACVNREMRAEVADFLRTAQVDMITTVTNFDYEHVTSYLSTLKDAKRREFALRVDGTASRQLTIRFRGPYRLDWSANLEKWLGFISATYGAGDELATAMKVVPEAIRWAECASVHGVTKSLYYRHRNQGSGVAREELWKTLMTFWGWLRAECLMFLGCDHYLKTLGRLARSTGLLSLCSSTVSASVSHD